MRLTIRRKLFLAFVAVLAVPLGTLAASSWYQLRDKRSQLDAEFADQARAALHAQGNEASNRLTLAGRGISEIANSLPKDAATLAQQANDNLAEAPQVVGLEFKGSGGTAFKVARDASGVFGEVPAVSKLLAYEDTVGAADSNHPTRPLRSFLLGEPRFERIKSLGEGHRSQVLFAGEPRHPQGLLLADFDVVGRVFPIAFARSSWVVFIQDGSLWPTGQYDRSLADLPGLADVARAHALAGSSGDIQTAGGLYHVYWATSPEVSVSSQEEGVTALAVIPAADLYAPLWQLRWRALVSVVFSLLLALGLASILSAQLVKAVQTVQTGVEALAHGDFQPLPRMSSDEIGRGLVETINRAGSRLAERTRQEEVETWRRLVRVMSHEINNTLAPIKSVAATLRRKMSHSVEELEGAEDFTTGLSLIGERVESLESFLGAFGELAKLPKPRISEVDWNLLVLSGGALVAESAKVRSTVIEYQLDELAGTVNLDPSQFERVVINLIKNAVEAAPEKGKVVVATRRHPLSLELTVEDDGPGIAQAKENLFVPFFTTKANGSGIGLALARQIVLSHGGLLTAEDAANRGALFRVTIPQSGLGPT